MKCSNSANAVRAGAVILKQLQQNLPRIIPKPNWLVGVVVRDIVISAGMGGSRGDAPPYKPFSNIFFDEYSFSIISNFFDNNKPYALRLRNQLCITKCIIFGETFRIRDENFKQNLPRNCSKSAKWPLQHEKFQKLSGGACSWILLQLFYSQFTL